jgi:hypothetical protein
VGASTSDNPVTGIASLFLPFRDTEKDITGISLEIIGFNCLLIVPSEHGNESSSSTKCEKLLTTHVSISFSIKINLRQFVGER